MTPARKGYMDLSLMADIHEACCKIAPVMTAIVMEELPTLVVYSKTSYSGQRNSDVVTSADLRAQQECVQIAEADLPPRVGFIGEESDLFRPCTLPGSSVVITIDPADGTRSLIRAFQEGRLPRPGEVSSMLGVLIDGVARGAYICDVTGPLYWCMPYGKRVMRVASDGAKTDMSTLPRATSLGEGVLLHHGRREPSASAQQLTGLFGRVDRGSDSIGLSLMRVFTGEFVAMLRPADAHITPWDDVPLLAMCRGGDVVMLTVQEGRLVEIRLDHLATGAPAKYGPDLLYIQRQLVPELGRHIRVELY